MIRLKLPIPPSVNALYSGNHRRFKSKRYKAWIAEAEGCIEGHHSPLAGNLEVCYRICSPDSRRRDIGNYEKALSDFLVDHKMIEDDSHIQRLVMEWADDITPGVVEVYIQKH